MWHSLSLHIYKRCISHYILSTKGGKTHFYHQLKIIYLFLFKHLLAQFSLHSPQNSFRLLDGLLNCELIDFCLHSSRSSSCAHFAGCLFSKLQKSISMWASMEWYRFYCLFHLHVNSIYVLRISFLSHKQRTPQELQSVATIFRIAIEVWNDIVKLADMRCEF